MSKIRLKLAKSWAKAKQHPETVLLKKMSKWASVALKWEYMINCNESENDNEK